MNINVIVLGLGSYGSSVYKLLYESKLLDDKEFNLVGYTRSPTKSKVKYELRGNIYGLDRIKIDNTRKNIVILGLPTSALEESLDDENIKNLLDSAGLVINLSKGMVGNIPSYQYLLLSLKSKISNLYGPTFSNEMDKGNLGFTFSVDGDTEYYSPILKYLFPERCNFDYSTNPLSCCYMSILKNVYAIACGVIDEYTKGNSSNYHYYLTKILMEYSHYIGETNINLYGGIGDFLMTTSSNTSRNRTLGRNIVLEGIESIESNIVLVEGYKSLSNIKNITERFPILYKLKQLIQGNIDVDEFMDSI